MAGDIHNGRHGPGEPDRYTYFRLAESGIAMRLYSDAGMVSLANSTADGESDLYISPSAERGVVSTTSHDDHISPYASLAYPMRSPRAWFRPESREHEARTVYVVCDDPSFNGLGLNRVICDDKVFCEVSMVDELIAGAAIWERKNEETQDVEEILWVVSWLYGNLSTYGYALFSKKYTLRQYNVKTRELINSISGSTEGTFFQYDPTGQRSPPLLTFHPDGSHAAFIYVPKVGEIQSSGTVTPSTWFGFNQLAGPLKYKKIDWEGNFSDLEAAGAPPVSGGSGSASYTAIENTSSSTFTETLGLSLFPQFDPVQGSDTETTASVESTYTGSSSLPYKMEYLEDGSLAFATISGSGRGSLTVSGHAHYNGVSISIGGSIEDGSPNGTPISEGSGHSNVELNESREYASEGTITLTLWDGVSVVLAESNYSHIATISGGGSGSSGWAVKGSPIVLPVGCVTSYESNTSETTVKYKITQRWPIHISLQAKFAVFLVQVVDANPDQTSHWFMDNNFQGGSGGSGYTGTFRSDNTFHSFIGKGHLEIYVGSEKITGPTVDIPGVGRETEQRQESSGTYGGWSGISPASNSLWVGRDGNATGSASASGTVITWATYYGTKTLPLAAPEINTLEWGADLYALSNWTHSATVGGVSLGAAEMIPGWYATVSGTKDNPRPLALSARGLLNYSNPWKAWVQTVGNEGDPDSPPKATESQVSSEISTPFNDFKRVAAVRPISS